MRHPVSYEVLRREIQGEGVHSWLQAEAITIVEDIVTQGANRALTACGQNSPNTSTYPTQVIDCYKPSFSLLNCCATIFVYGRSRRLQFQ